MALSRATALVLRRRHRALLASEERLFARAYREQLTLLRAASEPTKNPFNLPAWKKRVARAIRPVYDGIIKRAGRVYITDLYAVSRLRSRRKALDAWAPMAEAFYKVGGKGKIRQGIIRIEEDLMSRLSGTIETVWQALSDIAAEAVEDELGSEEVQELVNEEWSDIFNNNPEAIAATEANGAINSVNDYLAQVMVENQHWITARDERVRPTHVIYGEAEAKPVGFNFADLTDGNYTLRFPSDPQCDEPSEIVNCRCVRGYTKVRRSEVEAISKARYSGPVWSLETFRGYTLSVTANHPVLTSRGWLRADQLCEGDDLLCDSGRHKLACPADVEPDDEHGVTSVEDLFETFLANGGSRTVVVGSLDFHGDAARFVNGNVQTVFANGKLRKRFEVAQAKLCKDRALRIGRPRLHGLPLSWRGTVPPFKQGLASSDDPNPPLQEDPSDRPASDSVPARKSEQAHSRFIQGDSLFDRKDGPPPSSEPKRFAGGAPRDSAPFQLATDGLDADPEAYADIRAALAGKVTPDKLVKISVAQFEGFVFSVQTATGLAHTSGIVTHNCFMAPAGLVEIPEDELADYLSQFDLDREDLLLSEEQTV